MKNKDGANVVFIKPQKAITQVDSLRVILYINLLVGGYKLA